MVDSEYCQTANFRDFRKFSCKRLQLLEIKSHQRERLAYFGMETAFFQAHTPLLKTFLKLCEVSGDSNWLAKVESATIFNYELLKYYVPKKQFSNSQYIYRKKAATRLCLKNKFKFIEPSLD